MVITSGVAFGIGACFTVGVAVLAALSPGRNWVDRCAKVWLWMLACISAIMLSPFDELKSQIFRSFVIVHRMDKFVVFWTLAALCVVSFFALLIRLVRRPRQVLSARNFQLLLLGFVMVVVLLASSTGPCACSLGDPGSMSVQGGADF